MKKILVSLLVLVLCAPAMAVTVDIATSGVVTLTTEAGEANIVGVALELTVDGGAVINNLTTTAPFDIYPDAAYTQELGSGYVYGTGSPAAIIGGPGQATLPLANVAICFGNLNGETTPGADGAASVSFTVVPNVTTNLSLIENAERGGIVAVDGTLLDISSVTGAQIIVGGACVKDTAPFYADWVAFGSPDCWCYRKHCRGDADGANQSNKSGSWAVGTNDLDIFLPAWLVMEAPAGPGIDSIANGICADFAKDAQSNKSGSWRVGTNDLDLFLANWLVMDPAVADCPMDNFNSWTN